eukprot:724722-Amphidinium_carterae.1
MGCVADATYVLSGGVGALGLVTSTMMVEEGAKSLVLLSRAGKVGPDLQASSSPTVGSVAMQTSQRVGRFV